MSATIYPDRDPGHGSHAALPSACIAPARATRDVIGDGRPAAMVRRLFSSGGAEGRLVVEAMRRVCESEGLRVVALGAPGAPEAGTTPKSVLAWIDRDVQGDASAWSRLLALAARDDIDLVAIAGEASGSALSPCIVRAGEDASCDRAAEQASFGPQGDPVGPASVASGDDVGLRRAERLVADGRRRQARQVLTAHLARAARRGRADDDLPLRLALARLAHDDLQPADVCRVLLPALCKADGDGGGANGHDRLRAAVLACHASLDLLRVHQAQQLAGAATVTADALGLGVFEAAHAQWRVCWWLGDIDGALAQGTRLDAAAHTAMQQVVAHRCAIRTRAQRWPDEAASHRQWLRQHTDGLDREAAGLARRALAEDALASGDPLHARVWIQAATRAYGRRSSARARAAMATLALAVEAGLDARGVRPRPSMTKSERATPLLALCAETLRAGRSEVRRRRIEQRAAAVGVAITSIAPWQRPTGDHVMIEELLQVIEACHTDEGAPAMARLCSLVREHLGAAGVGLYTTPEGRPLAGVGSHPCVSVSVARDALARGVVVEPAAASLGLESAVPVRFGGAPIAALCCRWAYDAPLDRRRAALVMTAAAAVCAPVVQALIEARTLVDVPADDLGLLGASDAMRLLRVNIRRAASAPFPVLIEGESGAGKELVARAIHAASARRGRRFCAVNCAAVSDDLLEAELFGHVRGAFTGAVAERPGLFEEADGGTLFLDEVGDLSPRGQAKLLRVLQDGEVRRVGENVPRRLDVRVVAATNRTLAREVEVGRFRDDLRFRLDVVRIDVPSLRARPGDIEVLAQAFWRDALVKTRGRAVLERDAIASLARYDWPGNVRELQNVIATLAVRAPLRGRVTEADVATVRGGVATRVLAPLSTLEVARRTFDAALLRQTLAECGGRRTEAARRLGVTRQGLLKLMHRVGIDRPGGRAREGAAPVS